MPVQSSARESVQAVFKYLFQLRNTLITKKNYHLLNKKRIIGSNFKILDRTVLFEPHGAWKILSDWGFLGGNAEQTALRADSLSSPVLNFENLRRWRDSNSRGLAPYSLSKRAHSATMRHLLFRRGFSTQDSLTDFPNSDKLHSIMLRGTPMKNNYLVPAL